MLIDRKSMPWAAACSLATAGAAVWYALYVSRRPTGPSGGSWPGLLFGAAGSAAIVACMLLSARKSLRTAPLGKAQVWMRAHVWLGLISYPLIWLHAGLRVGGPLTTVLMVLFTLIWLSGLLGIYFQGSVPRRIMHVVPAATVHQQIAFVIARLRQDAQALVGGVKSRAIGHTLAVATVQAMPEDLPASANGDGAAADEENEDETEGERLLRAFYAARIDPLMVDQLPREVRRNAQLQMADAFATLRDRMPGSMQGTVTDLEDILRHRLQLEQQRRLHRFLHGWLLVHVPLSYAMLLLSIGHAIVALRYARIGGW